MMLKKLDVADAFELHTHLIEPTVYPYVRYKAETAESYMFVLKTVMEKEEKHELIMRTILNESGKPIGQIALYDIQNGTGFLGTWLGSSFQGKGYNQSAKESFFSEVFYGYFQIQTIYLKIRKTNIKSKKAANKLPYVEEVRKTEEIYKCTNKEVEMFDLYKIQKKNFEHYHGIDMLQA